VYALSLFYSSCVSVCKGFHGYGSKYGLGNKINFIYGYTTTLKLSAEKCIVAAANNQLVVAAFAESD
jgi:hypothetical protein